MLPEEENRALLRASVAFEKDMEPIRLIAHMIADGIFNDGDVERVRSKTTRGERVLEFVMIYKRKAQSLTALKDALLYDGLKHLVDVLDNSTHTDAHDAVGQANAGQLRSLLTLGGVPGTLPKHVERTVQLRSLGDTLLRSAAKGSFWVVLHGMAGCGKTTLSSDVLRSDARLIGDAFQRVIWVRCDDPPAEFQSQKLFKLLYNLHTKLGTGANADVKFDDVETALHFVRQAILDSYPNLLIVLDDVWSADIVGAFDELQCRILATTRNKSLFNVAICEKEFVAMNPVGFTKTEALNVLAQYAGCKPSELPNEASAIFQLCEGHPLVINLIGSLIREHEDRWQRYYEELKAQHLDDIEHKTPYRYSTFYKAAKISCDDLTPQQLKNFCAFAIFPVNVLVPDAVLAAIWPGDIPWKGKLIKVQDDMIELRDRSLIEETVATEIDRGRRRRFYSLHFLLHAYLKRFPSASQRDTQTLCRDLVEKLQAALHNQTRDFPDYDILEEFFYVNLGYFLYKANLRDHFPLFFLNLVELIRRLKWSTPSTILVEFHIYNRWIAHWDPSKMDAFLKFFRRNASHLRRVRNEIDAVQLSLVEASTSPVYEQAKKMAVKLLESDSTGNILLLEPCDRDTEADKRDALTLDGYVVGGSLFAALFLDQNGGLFVACSRQNRRLLICDARSGQTVKRIKLSGIVEKVSVSDSKSLVVSFRNDPRVLLYDVSAEPIVDDVMLLPDANAVTPSPVLLYLNGDRDRHRYSSVGDDSPSSEDEHAPTAVLPDVAYPIDCAISASGRRVAVLLENSLVVYDKSTMSALFKRAASAGKEDRIAFVDENTVLVGHLDGSFDMATETNTVTIRLNNFGDSKVRAFAVLANQVVVGDWQRRLFLRRLHDDWQTQTALPAGVASSHAIATSATTGLCAAGLNDCSVLLFHVLDGHLLPLSSLRGHGRPVQSVHFADHRLISTADDDTVVVWKISRTLTTTGKLDKFATMTASQRCTDRFIAASLFNDGSFMMRSSSSPARDISPTGVTGATCMAVAAAASLVAFGTERNTVEIYSQSNLQSPTSIVDLTEATSSLPVKLTMTTNGAYIGVVGMDGKLVLVSLRAGESPAISSHSIVNEAIVDVEFDASASRLLIATDRRLIRILSIPSMETVMERRMNGVGAISIIRHFSASQVLFTDGSGVVALVDLSSDGSFVTMANYSTDQIVDLRCSPCLRYVLCLSYDVVAIYDCKDSFKLVASVPCCDGSAVFSSDRCNKVFLIGRQADFRVFDRLKLS